MSKRNKADSEVKPESKKMTTSRRKLLKTSATAATVLAATELPRYWKSPVVNSVILPGHANTTDGGGTDLSGVVYFGNIGQIFRNSSVEQSSDALIAEAASENQSEFKVVEKIGDMLVSDANAQDVIGPGPIPIESQSFLCVTPNGSNYDVLLATQNGPIVIHRFTTVTLGSFRVLVTSPLCNILNAFIEVRVSNPTQDRIDYEIRSNIKAQVPIAGFIPATPCAVPPEVCPVSDGQFPEQGIE